VVALVSGFHVISMDRLPASRAVLELVHWGFGEVQLSFDIGKLRRRVVSLDDVFLQIPGKRLLTNVLAFNLLMPGFLATGACQAIASRTGDEITTLAFGRSDPSLAGVAFGLVGEDDLLLL